MKIPIKESIKEPIDISIIDWKVVKPTTEMVKVEEDKLKQSYIFSHWEEDDRNRIIENIKGTEKFLFSGKNICFYRFFDTEFIGILMGYNPPETDFDTWLSFLKECTTILVNSGKTIGYIEIVEDGEQDKLLEGCILESRLIGGYTPKAYKIFRCKIDLVKLLEKVSI